MIPCRNEAGTIRSVLDALLRQDRQPDEMVVVDDASSDGTADVVRGWLADHAGVRLEIVRTAGHGAGAAMNVGIRQVHTDIIVRLDGHCRPAADYVRRSIDALALPKVGVAGGVWKVEPGADTRTARAIAQVVSHRLASGGARYRHPPAGGGASRSVETVPFGAFRRAVWEQLGGYEERLLSNQDYDFNYRARRAGYRVLLDPAIRCVYVARASLRRLAQQYLRYGLWKARMLRKSPAALHWRQIPPALIVPWLTGCAGWMAASPGPLPTLATLIYPAAVIAAAVHIAGRSRDPILIGPAAAAFLVVHLSWSVGFWAGLITSGRAGPRSSSAEALSAPTSSGR